MTGIARLSSGTADKCPESAVKFEKQLSVPEVQSSVLKVQSKAPEVQSRVPHKPSSLSKVQSIVPEVQSIVSHEPSSVPEVLSRVLEVQSDVLYVADTGQRFFMSECWPHVLITAAPSPSMCVHGPAYDIY